MEFANANPSIVRSIKQRVLLNTWLRAARRRRPLPLISEFQADESADERADMMGFRVDGYGEEARFVITYEGARLTAAYGNSDVHPSMLTERFLDDAIGPERYARVVPSYRACLAHKRPTYSISAVQDADGKQVSYERLLLPFGGGESVEEIIGSYKAISIAGGFKVDNLMGVAPQSTPVSVVNAVINMDLASLASHQLATNELLELD